MYRPCVSESYLFQVLVRTCQSMYVPISRRGQYLLPGGYMYVMYMYISYSYKYIHNHRSGRLNHRPIVVPEVARFTGQKEKKNYDTNHCGFSPSVSVRKYPNALFLHYCTYAIKSSFKETEYPRRN